MVIVRGWRGGGEQKSSTRDNYVWTEQHHSTSEVTTLWCYTDLFIIIIIII